ncbi:aromatic amino acid hydroxylase [Mucilaginibacter galii]|nr:aromatic amino acid hydroxylase [Mucilaginibacter galii]
MSDFDDFNNPQVAALPRHLRQYIVPQQYSRYTAVDQAVWRYVMRQNYSYLKDFAYYPYIPGLRKAGLTIERIPDLQEMNNALGRIGWGAVTVDGFIPPVAFMEYQAYKVLVIAADIRQLHHIEYTPAPDIIHESAGHAPIIAEPDYHAYLSYFGQIGAKAMFSAQDFELYEAIRRLSILKEMPDANGDAIIAAEEQVAWCQANMGQPSEMALLSRLHWWSVEYGLIGTLENPKIYGAGLLSSIGESATCMKPEIKKLWYNIDTINYTYDITREQPQLFVTPSFQNLIDVLDEYANTMSFRVGGIYGLEKAVNSMNVCTAVYSSGLQVSGVFTGFTAGNNDQPLFIKTTGPTALAVDNTQLDGHGKNYHKDGFSSPVGKITGYDKPLENFTAEELQTAGLILHHTTVLKFEAGIVVQGRVENILSQNSQIQLITFTQCTVTNAKGQLLFDPSWGNYDMAVGEKIVSVFCGTADKDAFENVTYKSTIETYHAAYDDATLNLQSVYQEVRNIRGNQSGYDALTGLWQQLQTKFTDDWLCSLEILELLHQENMNQELQKSISGFLANKAAKQLALSKLIQDGLALIAHPIEQD